MQFNVPAYSQFIDIKNKKWRHRSCGIVALKMAMEYFDTKRIFSADDLIKIGIRYNAYITHIGWRHKGLIQIARHYGFYGKNFDWFNKTPELAFNGLLKNLKRYPVLASIYKTMNPKKGGGHLITLTGFTKTTIFYNDPDSKTKRQIKRKTSIAKFLKGWKRRLVIIYLSR